MSNFVFGIAACVSPSSLMYAGLLLVLLIFVQG